MKKSLLTIIMIAATLSGAAQTMDIKSKGDTTVITVTSPTKYMILPVEENTAEKQVKLDKGLPTDTWMDVRLAENKVDYNVPFELGNGPKAVVKIAGLKPGYVALKNIKLSNEGSVVNTD